MSCVAGFNGLWNSGVEAARERIHFREAVEFMKEKVL
jgi:hypothetical protein